MRLGAIGFQKSLQTVLRVWVRACAIPQESRKTLERCERRFRVYRIQLAQIGVHIFGSHLQQETRRGWREKIIDREGLYIADLLLDHLRTQARFVQRFPKLADDLGVARAHVVWGFGNRNLFARNQRGDNSLALLGIA